MVPHILRGVEGLERQAWGVARRRSVQQSGCAAVRGCPPPPSPRPTHPQGSRAGAAARPARQRPQCHARPSLRLFLCRGKHQPKPWAHALTTGRICQPVRACKACDIRCSCGTCRRAGVCAGVCRRAGMQMGGEHWRCPAGKGRGSMSKQAAAAACGRARACRAHLVLAELKQRERVQVLAARVRREQLPQLRQHLPPRGLLLGRVGNLRQRLAHCVAAREARDPGAPLLVRRVAEPGVVFCQVRAKAWGRRGARGAGVRSGRVRRWAFAAAGCAAHAMQQRRARSGTACCTSSAAHAPRIAPLSTS